MPINTLPGITTMPRRHCWCCGMYGSDLWESEWHTACSVTCNTMIAWAERCG